MLHKQWVHGREGTYCRARTPGLALLFIFVGEDVGALLRATFFAPLSEGTSRPAPFFAMGLFVGVPPTHSATNMGKQYVAH